MSTESRDIPSVLIVDDDANIRGFVTVGLTAAGYRVSAVQSAEEAELALALDPFDLVLLGTSMPVKSCMEYLPKLLSEHPDIAVVMLTEEADLQTAIQSMREGASDYISKPVGLADLMIHVKKAMSKRAWQLDNKGIARSPKCTKCGSPVAADDSVCDSCGTPVAGKEAATIDFAPQPEEASTSAPRSLAEGRYTVLEFLGQGGTKTVYRSHDTLLDREVAVALIKVADSTRPEDSECCARRRRWPSLETTLTSYRSTTWETRTASPIWSYRS